MTSSLTYNSAQHIIPGTPPHSARSSGLQAGYFPAFARSIGAASSVKPLSSAASLLAVLDTPPSTPLSPLYDPHQQDIFGPSSPLMSSASLPFPTTTNIKGASTYHTGPRSMVFSVGRKVASKRSLKTYRKVLVSLAAAFSLFYLYTEINHPTTGGRGWSSYLLPRPIQPKTFDFTEPKLAGSRDHLLSFLEHHINPEDLASTDPGSQHQGVSFVNQEEEGEFGYFAEDEMLEDGGETDEASHRATMDADQMSPAERERRTRRKLEHALEIVAKRRASGSRSITSLADRNGLPDVYLEAIHAHTEIDISHPDVTPEQVVRLVDIVDHTRHVTLRTLIWFLSRGMKLTIASDPAKMEGLMKAVWSTGGGRGLEMALKKAEEGEHGEEEVGTRLEDRVFWEGWQDAADDEGSITIFSKSYCPFSKRAKDIFTKYQMANPDVIRPVIFELDQRSDGPLIQSLLKRLTGRRTVPNIVVDFTSIGGADEISLMDSEGSLRTLLMQSKAQSDTELNRE